MHTYMQMQPTYTVYKHARDIKSSIYSMQALFELGRDVCEIIHSKGITRDQMQVFGGCIALHYTQ